MAVLLSCHVILLVLAFATNLTTLVQAKLATWLTLHFTITRPDILVNDEVMYFISLVNLVKKRMVLFVHIFFRCFKLCFIFLTLKSFIFLYIQSYFLLKS